MATCQNCGAELNGHYCNTCGARAPEERASKKAVQKPSVPHKQPAGRGPGLFSAQRIGRTTAVGLLVLLGFGAGLVTGYWMGTSAGGSGAPLTSTAVDATSTGQSNLSALGLAGQYMDEGVENLNKGDRTSAVASFRKAIAQYEKVIKEEPDNLYAKSYLGLTYYYAGDSKKALDYENAVLKQDENYLWAIFNLAWIYETADKKTESLMMYKKYLAVVDKEKENQLKYAEQYELIDRQVEAAKTAVAAAEGGGTK